MKKVLIIAVAMLFASLQASAQKVGYINTEKILSAIPEYKSAQAQLENLGNQYSQKIESEYAKIEAMYQNYQQQKGTLSAQARAQRENEIISREQTVKELQKTYFGQDGLMQKKSEELLNPLKERVDAAIKKIAENGNFMIIFDTSLMQGVAYARESDDLSGLVIKALGY
ncbi:MAG: OmpH family outer membrane protein [Bacteroidales bacterium]|nr:OmpH family outer membrane protein [Bacteroidales bacterium]